MSILAINKLTRDLEHSTGAVEKYRTDPESVLESYQLSADERSAIRKLDATDLLDRGVNPIVIRNLLVLLGIKHGELYTHGKAE